METLRGRFQEPWSGKREMGGAGPAARMESPVRMSGPGNSWVGAPGVEGGTEAPA